VDELSWSQLPVQGLSAGAMVAAFWFLLARGLIVTRREYREAMALKDQLVAIYKEAAVVSNQHADDLAEVARVQLRILAGIERIAADREGRP